MKKIAFISLALTSIFLVGCDKSPVADIQACSLTTTTGNSCTASSEKTNINLTALDTAKTILKSLKNKDMQTLGAFVGPKGVRFSPYTYVNTDTDIILNKEEVTNGLALSRTFIRWSYDWSGEPIDLPFWQYFEKFVYDLDFLNAPEVNENKEIMRGNVINNIFDIYTNAQIIEFFIPGIDPQYEGMDRRSLTIVLEKNNETRNLIGIIHNQWTI